MGHERREPQHRVVAPIGPAIALPPGAADGVGAHAKPHAELKDARERAGRGKAHDQPLENAEIGIGLHDANETENGFRRHETVGVERHREFMLAAPALAEFTDVAGLVGGVDRTAPVGDRDPVAPARGKRCETRLLAARDVGVAGVAEDIEMETLAAAGGIEARQHRLEIADHPLRQLVADAQQDRGRSRHRLVAADARRHRHDRRNRIGGKTHDQKADHGVPESRHHPGQCHREQHKQHDVDNAEAAR